MIPFGLYKYLAVAIAVVLLGVAAKVYISHLESAAYDRSRAELQAELDARSLKLALAYAERIKLAEEERDENQVTVDRLSADVRRLRIKHPTPRCPATPASENPDRGAGVLSDGVDAAFAELQRETTILVERCDRLNLDAIEANSSAGH